MKTTRKRNIKNLEYFLKNCNQPNLYDLLRGSIYINGAGWTKFNLSDEAKTNLGLLVAEALEGHQNTRVRIANNVKYNRVELCGILQRIILENRKGGKLKVFYIAGQDYTSETQFLRNHLKK